MVASLATCHATMGIHVPVCRPEGSHQWPSPPGRGARRRRPAPRAGRAFSIRVMRALAKVRPEHGLELIERPAPTPGPGEVLLKVDAASICGTDLHLFEWDDWAADNLQPPRILGHELAGTVISSGD